MRLIVLLFLSALIFPGLVPAQKNDYLWPLGLGPKYSEFRFFLNFHTDPPSILLRDDTMSTGVFTGVYCNDLGEITAYSNGLWILNKNGELIENAYGLNPTLTQGQTTGSYGGHQSGFFIERPDHPQILYFIHLDYGYHPANDWTYRYVGRHLMVTTLDLSANNGAGKAVAKNEILLDGVLMTPAAVRHANGRDWWIMVSDADENRHYRLLLTPQGFQGPYTQEIGTKPNPVLVKKLNSGAGNTFSPGGRYYVDNNSYTGFSLFDFDRCSGLLGNERRLNWPEPDPIFPWRYESGSGVVFSPDERLLYITATYDHIGLPIGSIPLLYQFDLSAPDLSTAFDTVNPLDTFYYPYKFDVFENMWGAEMGPDGRIYAVHRGDSYCTVHYPNVRGKGCKFVYDKPDFHNTIGEAIPVFPTYRLGPNDGSPCDTLGLNNVPVANFRVEDTLGPLARFFYDLSYKEPASWSWDFGDGGMSQDTNPIHQYAQAGKYRVCLTVANANGSDTFCRDVYAGITAEREPQAAEPSFMLYPNPARESVFLAFDPEAPPQGRLTVWDAYGRPVLARALEGGPTLQLIDVRGWQAGVYLIAVETPAGIKTVKCLVGGS